MCASTIAPSMPTRCRTTSSTSPRRRGCIEGGMAEEPQNFVLESLRRISAEFAGVREELQDLKARIASLEQHVVQLRQALAFVHQHLVRLEHRMDRMDG